MEEVLPMETLSPSCLGSPGKATNTGTDLENVSLSMPIRLWGSQTVPGCGTMQHVPIEESTFVSALPLLASKNLGAD